MCMRSCQPPASTWRKQSRSSNEYVSHRGVWWWNRQTLFAAEESWRRYVVVEEIPGRVENSVTECIQVAIYITVLPLHPTTSINKHNRPSRSADSYTFSHSSLQKSTNRLHVQSQAMASPAKYSFPENDHLHPEMFILVRSLQFLGLPLMHHTEQTKIP